MKNFLELNEIKAMTKDQFKKLLRSEGYCIIDIKDDYRLFIFNLDKKEFEYVRYLYGASGTYSEIYKSGTLGDWGCNDSMYDVLDTCQIDIQKIFKEISSEYYAKLRPGLLAVIIIQNIPEAEFRQLMIKYYCHCAVYNDELKRGHLIFNTQK